MTYGYFLLRRLSYTLFQIMHSFIITHYVNIILLNHGEIARIQVERIDASFRENIGYVFYYPLGSDKLTSTVFEGEVKINDVNQRYLGDVGSIRM